MQVLLEITKFHLHKSVLGAGIIRNAGIIRGRALYEEIRYIGYPLMLWWSLGLSTAFCLNLTQHTVRVHSLR